MLFLKENTFIRYIRLLKITILIYFISVMEKSREKQVLSTNILVLPE